jgi:predicted outer membrane protein
MSASPKMRFGIAAAGLSCLFAGYVVAQQQVGEREDAAIDQPAAQNPAIGQREGQIDRATTERREYTANFRGNQANTGAQSKDVQRYIAGCLLSKNKAEVEMAEFAQQKAETPEVKEFAQKMVQDHGKLVQQLQGLAGTQAGAQTGISQQRETSGQVDAEQTTTANRTADKNSPVDKLLALERQITERCTQMAREELEQKQGVEFDKCYMSAQIGGHMQMLAALEVIQQQGPEQIQQIAQQAHPKVKQHLDHAKQLMKQLEGDSDTTGSREARQPSRTQPATQ